MVGLLRVLECGHTKTIGQVVTIKSKKHFAAQPEGVCCYLEGGGHFNLYDEHGCAEEHNFTVGAKYLVRDVIKQGNFIYFSYLVPYEEPIINQESVMNGNVYKGVVVRNKVVAQGEGVTTGVNVSEIVFEQTESFIAANESMAKAQILVDAKLSLKDKLDLKSLLQPLEVILK